MTADDISQALADATPAATVLVVGTNAALPFFGVGMTTLGMAVTGSMLAFAYATPVRSWYRLLGYALGGVFAGVWGVILLPHILNWQWFFEIGPDIAGPPLAGFIALSSRWTLPFVFENLPSLWGRLTSRTEGGSRERDN